MGNQHFFGFINNDLLKKAHLDTAMEETDAFLKEAATINASNSFVLKDIHELKNKLTVLQASLNDLKNNRAVLDNSTFMAETTKQYRNFGNFLKEVQELPEMGYTEFGKVEISEPIKGIQEHHNSLTKSALVFGVASFLSLISLSLVVPEWTRDNSILFKTLLALASACIAVTLPGFLNLNFSNIVKAGGSLGVFGLVYFLNPAEQQKEFDLLVNLGVNENGAVLPLKGKNDELLFQVEGTDYKKNEKVDEKGEARFANIPSGYSNKVINFNLISKYYKLKTPLVAHKLKPESSVTLEVVPKTIEKISGTVQVANGAGIEGVKIMIDNDSNLSTVTSVAGNFTLSIPNESQKPKLTIFISKEGYMYSNTQANFHSEYDVESAQNIKIYLTKKATEPTKPTARANPSAPSMAINNTVEYIPLILKYDNKKTPFVFPIDDERKVEDLRNYICDALAVAYSTNRIQCQIKSFGTLLNINQKVKDLKIAANTEIYLECNGHVIPMKRLTTFFINGKDISKPMVYINGKFVNTRKVDRGLTGSTSPLFFNFDKGNNITIYDISAKKKYIYQGVKISANFDSHNSEFIFTIKKDKMLATAEPTKVVLYENKNYTGDYWVLYGKNAQLTTEKDFNNRALSIKIPRGSKVRIYDNEKRGDGKSIELTESCPDLGKLGLGKKVSYIEEVSSIH